MLKANNNPLKFLTLQEWENKDIPCSRGISFHKKMTNISIVPKFIN
jgi:hypothetical protein